jgi:hypothetical protein
MIELVAVVLKTYEPMSPPKRAVPERAHGVPVKPLLGHPKPTFIEVPGLVAWNETF